jgi:hypothetical protein
MAKNGKTLQWETPTLRRIEAADAKFGGKKQIYDGGPWVTDPNNGNMLAPGTS